MCLLTARAIGLCHATGLAHRDIKLTNLLVTDDDKVLLADLGLALAEGDERLTENYEQIGSRFYIAPENESGINLTNDQRPADAYAFGKVMWSLLTGRTPLAREAILDPPQRLVSQLGDPHLAPLDTLLVALLDADPRSRLIDWSDVVGEIERVRAAVAGSNDATVIESAGDGLESALARLEASQTNADNVRRSALDRHRQTRWQEIVSALDRRVYECVEEEIERLTSAAARSGVRIFRSGGGPAARDLVAFPSLSDLPVVDPPEWLGRQNASNLLNIEAVSPGLPRRVYVSSYVIPIDDRVIFVRAPFCYPEEQQQPLFQDWPSPIIERTDPVRADLDGATALALAFAEESVRQARIIWVDFIDALAEGRPVEDAIKAGHLL